MILQTIAAVKWRAERNERERLRAAAERRRLMEE